MSGLLEENGDGETVVVELGGQPRFALVQDLTENPESVEVPPDNVNEGAEAVEGIGPAVYYKEIHILTTEAEHSSDTQPLENAFYKAFGISACPECNTSDCCRPVQEHCGHVKCRTCFVSNDFGCKQCNIRETEPDPTGFTHLNEEEKENDVGEEVSNDVTIRSSSDSDSTSEEEDEDGGMDEMYIDPAPTDCVFHFEDASGKSAIAIVSSETCKELELEQRSEAPFDESGSRILSIELQDPETSCNEGASDENTKSTMIPKGKRLKRRQHKMDESHIIQISIDPLKYSCQKCTKEFKAEYHRRFHMFCNPVNGKRPFKCERGNCNKEFTSRSHFEYHVRSKHTQERPYQCPKCERGFFQKVKLTRHLKSHKDGKCQVLDARAWVCVFCNKRFNAFANCKRHLRIHTEDKPFECDTCHKTFGQKYTLDVHIRTHLQVRPHVCNQCDKAFSNSKDLRRHALCHTGDKPFACTLCTTKFRRKDNLERHIRQTHKQSETVVKAMSTEAAIAAERHIRTLPGFSDEDQNQPTARSADDIDYILGEPV